MASGFQSFAQGRKALDAVRKAINGKSAIDRKAVDKVRKQIMAVVKLCANPRLNITNSPPCILDILPDTCAHMQLVLDKCNENFEALNECPYFRVLLDNLAEKCRRVLQLFKTSKEAIYDEHSVERRSLTKFSLLFSHIYSELKALYPNGVCVGKSFPITKSAAAQFWQKHFGDRFCVAWRDFVSEFERVHVIRSNMEVIALKSTIDITCNDHVSVFEFDVFTLLFQPWATIVRNWNVLAVTHPGYQAFLTYDEVKDKLLKIQTNRVGSYLYRLSCTRLGQWAIGHITAEGNIVQTIPQNKSLIQALVDGQKEGFYLHPMGQEHNPDISCALADVQTETIQVTQEQYELYMEIDSSFELCKICTVKAKDVRIEPCCHLVCSECLEHWLESNGNGCPFCRMEIKSTEPVVIQPFQKENRDYVQATPPAVPSIPVVATEPVHAELPVDFRPHCPSVGEETLDKAHSRSFSVGAPPSRSVSTSGAPPVPCRRTPSQRRKEGTTTAPKDRPPLPAVPASSPTSAAAAAAAVPTASSLSTSAPLSIPPIDYASGKEIKECLAGTHPKPAADYSTVNMKAKSSVSQQARAAAAAASEAAASSMLPPTIPQRTPAADCISNGTPPHSPSSRHNSFCPSSPQPRSSPSIDSQLSTLGYSQEDIQKAVLIAGNDIDLAKRILANFKTQEKKTLEEELLEMGYIEEDVKKAIAIADNNRELALMILQQFAQK